MNPPSSASLRSSVTIPLLCRLIGCLALAEVAPLKGESATVASPAAGIGIEPPGAGAVIEQQFHSKLLNEDVHYLAYLPIGYPEKGIRYPVLYLLHGRGDTMRAWLEAKPALDGLICTGRIPPLIAIMPDAPFSQRASYYIDSQFTGKGGASPTSLPPGQPVESVFVYELVAAIDARYPTQPERAGRIIAGYSMGGYGALHFALGHPDVFGAAIVLSPAVYVPLPPSASSTREFGAFGRGDSGFDAAIYRANNYPALLPAFQTSGLHLVMFIGVGDLEEPLRDPAEANHDLDYEAHTLYNRLRRVPTIAVRFRVVGGGHGWETWRPTFAEGLELVCRRLSVVTPRPQAQPTR